MQMALDLASALADAAWVSPRDKTKCKLLTTKDLFWILLILLDFKVFLLINLCSVKWKNMSHFVQWWCKVSINKTFNYMFDYIIHACIWVSGKIPVNPSVSIKLDSKTGQLTTVCSGFFQRWVIGLVCIIDIGVSFRQLSRFHSVSLPALSLCIHYIRSALWYSVLCVCATCWLFIFVVWMCVNVYVASGL